MLMPRHRSALGRMVASVARAKKAQQIHSPRLKLERAAVDFFGLCSDLWHVEPSGPWLAAAS